MSAMKEHAEWLEAYINEKIKSAADPAPLEIKRAHTFNVYENAKKIIAEEGWAPDQARAGLLAALYHDIARFDQYLLYGTFKDAESFNHGAMGVRLLKKERRLDNESPEIRSLALAAVGLHNRRAIPAKLAPKARGICAAVRDADKLDIIRVIDGHLKKKPYCPTVILGLPDDDKGNPLVAESVMNEKCPGYGDLWSVNDFRVLLGAWLFSLNFKSSRRIFLAGPHAESIVSALPDNRAHGRVKGFLLRAFRKQREELEKEK